MTVERVVAAAVLEDEEVAVAREEIGVDDLSGMDGPDSQIPWGRGDLDAVVLGFRVEAALLQSVILGDASVDRPVEAALGLAERQAGENARMRTGFQVAEKLFELPGALVELADGLFVGFLVGFNLGDERPVLLFLGLELDLLGRRLLRQGGDLGLLFPQLPVGLAQGGQPGEEIGDDPVLGSGDGFERPDLVDEGSQIARFQGIAGDAETAVLVDGEENPGQPVAVGGQGVAHFRDASADGVPVGPGPGELDLEELPFASEKAFPDGDPVQLGENGSFPLFLIAELRPEPFDVAADLGQALFVFDGLTGGRGRLGLAESGPGEEGGEDKPAAQDGRDDPPAAHRRVR